MSSCSLEIVCFPSCFTIVLHLAVDVSFIRDRRLLLVLIWLCPENNVLQILSFQLRRSLSSTAFCCTRIIFCKIPFLLLIKDYF